MRRTCPRGPSAAWIAIAVLGATATGRAQLQPQAPSPPAGAALNAPAAPESAVEPAGYRAAIDEAIREYEGNRFAEARALFERANTLYPNARALRGLGMAEFELRNYAASIYYLEQALASPVKPLQDELRNETEQLLARARGFVGRLRLELTPPHAQVMLNGTRVQLGPDRVLALTVGDYTMDVSAPGYSAEQRPVRIAGGEEQTLKIELAKPVELLVSPTSPHPATPAAPRDADTSVFESPWLWAAVGVAIAGAAVGVGFALSGDAGSAAANGGTTNTVLQAR